LPKGVLRALGDALGDGGDVAHEPVLRPIFDLQRYYGSRDAIMSYEVVGSQVLIERGGLRCIRYWLHGWHPLIGKIIWGLTGQETIVDQDVIVPLRRISVRETDRDAT
jgi:hypothetical protein